jgi:hypothetical protein
MNSHATTGNGSVFRASDALRLSPIPALRHLTVEEGPGQVILSGRLPSYYYKQLAQETVLPYLGSRELVNQVVVVAKG